MGNAAATPAFPATPSTTLTVKLLIDKEAQRVLLAEAGKDVVDFLFGLLAMPVGAVLKLLGKDNGALSSVANIYASVGKMDAAFMQSPGARNSLLNPYPVHPSVAAAAGGFPSLVPNLPLPPPPPHPHPHPPPGNFCEPPPQPPQPLAPVLSTLKGLPAFGAAATTSMFCRCSACLGLVSICPAGGAYAGQGPRGFVQDVVTYTIMDDLIIMPMSNISGIALLSKLGVEDVAVLEEKTVKIGYQEVDFMRAYLISFLDRITCLIIY